MIAIKTKLVAVPEECDDCIYYTSRPNPFRGWSEFCELCMETLDDSNSDRDWVWGGEGRPKNCPIFEVNGND